MATPSNTGSGAALTSPSRLRKIDVLREKNIGQYLPLPQLVAVGDQSSGKSSLLESITGIPFPHGQELCTRYATQITHRRDTVQRIEVGIIPAPQATPEHAEKLKAYHRQFQSDKELLKEFPALLNEVNAAMGIRTKANPVGIHTFSEDILKIEKCGPNEDYLTVIDVPGIFRTTAEGITTTDRDLVKNMVKRYIKDDRTIILAVIPANVDVATQEILELAKEYDKTGDRTLGVLTKPDAVLEKSQKLSVCNLVLGNRMQLALGYFIVRNRGGDDGDDKFNIAEREKMFLDDPWNTIPRERVGVQALRTRLQELLGQITDKAFPKLLSEIRCLLNETGKNLDALGPARSTEREQQAYLMKVVTKFQELVRDALGASYSHDDAFQNRELRLVTNVLNLTAEFNTIFTNISHSHCFKAVGKDVQFNGHNSISISERTSSDPEDLITTDKMQVKDMGDSAKDALVEFPELAELIFTDCKIEPPQDDIMDWIGKMRLESRGVELGTFSSTMFSSAFRDQSQNWRGLTEQYLSQIIWTIHRFFHKALEQVCPDARMSERLCIMVMDGLLDRYSDGLKHALMLVTVEREKRPYTWSGVFDENVQHYRGQRVADSLASKVRLEQYTNNVVVDHAVIGTSITKRGNIDFEKEEIHDMLKAYYNVARKRFIDNIWHQAVDHVLLTGPTSPLGLLSEQWVMTLTGDQLEMVAGELRSVVEKREALQKKIADLKEAMAALR